MRPAEGKLRSIAGGIGDKTIEPGVAIDLEQSAVAFQMLFRVTPLRSALYI
jgi:hypothetical protein